VVGIAVGVDRLVEQFRRRELDGDAEPRVEKRFADVRDGRVVVRSEDRPLLADVVGIDPRGVGR